MVLTPGECQCLSIPWTCLWMGSGSSFGQAGKPQAAGKGSSGLAASHPHLSCGAHTETPHPAPLCLSGQDDGPSRPPPQFGSIYHVRGNGTLQPPVVGRSRGCSARGGTRLSQCQTGHVLTAKCLFLTHHPWGHCLGQLWVCRLWGAQGGMSGF